jgi:transcriptional regulator with XRE-family HTH domain
LPVSIQSHLSKLRQVRRSAGLSRGELEERLILGPGWIEKIERGEYIPDLGTLVALLSALNTTPAEFFRVGPGGSIEGSVLRPIHAAQVGADLEVHFRYAKHDAVYLLRDATVGEFQEVAATLRNGLARLDQEEVNAEAVKTDSVASAFLRAADLWPHASPSDLWWFVVYRLYLDYFNHPASFSRLDLGQSWKRTGGWALEQVLVRHYSPFLARHGVKLAIETGQQKALLLAQLTGLDDRLEADKADVLLSGILRGQEVCFGVVHVKASFAERRTDDVPMSRSLVQAGYLSPLWTMDCKSSPADNPENRGELGRVLTDGRDQRSAKRKDIEDDGYFSGCFSYNANTLPTPTWQQANARVYTCTLINPDDEFSSFVLNFWRRWSASRR